MEYNIEELKENIYNQKTKSYFEEVFNSYLAKSYRSAIVMLWTVLICDLWFKIEDLSDRYGDGKAEKLLKEIRELKERETRDLTKWECSLVDEIYTRLNIIDPYVKQSIEHLKDDRNLCAHPTLTLDSLLFNPSKERTISHIKSMLEGVLIKPPFLSRDILSRMLDDIALIKDSFFTDEQLEKYVSSKYLPRFQSETTIEVYKGLWKFVFKLDDENCSRDREINFRILKLIFKNDRVKCFEKMKIDNEYFNNISNKEEILSFLVRFLILDFEIWNKLSSDNKLIIEGYVRKDVNLLLKFYSSQGNEIQALLGLEKAQEVLDEQIKKADVTSYKVITAIDKETVSYLYNKNYSVSFIAKLNSYFISSYGSAGTFASADKKFTNHIKPFLQYYSINDFKVLIENINGNNQTFWRGSSLVDHSLLIKFIKDTFIGEDIEFVKEIANYDKLAKYVQQQEQNNE